PFTSSRSAFTSSSVPSSWSFCAATSLWIASTASFTSCSCSPRARCASASWRRSARSSALGALGGAGRGGAGSARPASRSRQAVRSDRRLEHAGVVLALPAADDLAVALGREHVDAEGNARIGGIRLHVERLRLHRIAVDHHGTVELLRERRLLVAAEVGAPF